MGRLDREQERNEESQQETEKERGEKRKKSRRSWTMVYNKGEHSPDITPFPRQRVTRGSGWASLIMALAAVSFELNRGSPLLLLCCLNKNVLSLQHLPAPPSPSRRPACFFLLSLIPPPPASGFTEFFPWERWGECFVVNRCRNTRSEISCNTYEKKTSCQSLHKKEFKASSAHNSLLHVPWYIKQCSKMKLLIMNERKQAWANENM